MAIKTRKKPAAKQGKKKKAGMQLTLLAMALLGVSLVWVIVAGGFAVNDIFDRRSRCMTYLVSQGASEAGYLRVYNDFSERKGCSLSKIGFGGSIAKQPIYPSAVGMALIFGVPVALIGFYLSLLKMRRGLIIRKKKKKWAKAKPLDFNDVEDLRHLDEVDSGKKTVTDAASLDSARKETGDKTDENPAEPVAASDEVPTEQSPTETETPPPAKNDEKDGEGEEGLSELEKIFRQQEKLHSD